MSTIGAFTIGVGTVIFLYAIITSWRSGKPASSNPWAANTLEWQVPTPVPLENFTVLPVVNQGPYNYGVPDPLAPTPADTIPETVKVSAQ